MKYVYSMSFILFFLLPGIAGAQAAVDLSQLSAQGVAIYGWRSGVPTVLYEEKDDYLFPIASITKLVTAKVAIQMYPANSIFTISKESMIGAFESDSLIVPGMQFSRDDMLQALLIQSNNAVANQFVMSDPTNTFITQMNTFLHDNKYTTTDFTNPSGLDPLDETIPPNRLTLKSTSKLLSDIYTKDPFLTALLLKKSSVITNIPLAFPVPLSTTNKLNKDPLYSNKILISKTGITDEAGQTLAFVTSGEGKYDYVTVVFAQSKDRYTDGKRILDWLDQVLHFRVY